MAAGDLINIYRWCCSDTLAADNIYFFALCIYYGWNSKVKQHNVYWKNREFCIKYNAL